MKQVQKGFTLIELMIVVAIIGILAAIALPAYQDYTARAQASEALTATAGLRTDLALHHAENNAWPAAASPVHTDAALIAGRFINAGGVALGVGTGVITVTFASGALNGQAMTLTPAVAANTNQITRWTCAGLTRANHLPSGCR